MKKVLLFLVDSMMPQVLEQCVAKEKAPAFRFFMERGQYIPDCVTVFPTMTASIDCSLITGVYPDRHKVPGLVWYDSNERTIVNYINGARPVAEIGWRQCARNVLFDLNERHLSRDVKTIHEEIEERGLTSGSINVIAHRGLSRHKLRLPLFLQVLSGFQLNGSVSGPAILSLGTLVKPSIFRPINWTWAQTGLSAYGVNDAYAIDVLIEVVKSGQQPDFTLIYLPDNDHKLHKTPELAEEHLSEVDRQIARFLDSFASWEQALERNVFVFISDHGQTVVGRSPDHNIPLDQLLSSFRRAKLGMGIQPGDQLVICNNERMTYVYPLAEGVLPQVVEALVTDERIDVIAWKEGAGVEVRQGGTRRRLAFRDGGPLIDVYGRRWTVEGDPAVLDLHVGNDGVLSFDAYPDALSRLYGALYARDESVVVLTARPGYEFLSEGSPTHLGGGSHGSLHKQDSLIPLLVAGTKRAFPRPARLVDVKSFILEELAVSAVVG